MDVLKQQILPYLKTDFEKDLLEAALNNLNDSSNKLRLNNVAYAARELTRHFLERLAPDADVRNAPWFVPHDPERSKMITREERIKYAIQGYLSDDFRKDGTIVAESIARARVVIAWNDKCLDTAVVKLGKFF